MALSFAFDTSKGETPETLKRKRRLAEALFGSTATAPRNVGEGLSSIGNAILFRALNGQIKAGEEAGQKSASDAMAALFGGGGAASSGAGEGAKALFGKRPDTSRSGSTIDFAHAADGASSAPAGNIEAYIREAAAARGIDPDIAVTVARAEGGLKDPTRQSLVRKNGRQEPSYGPFQLLIGGGDTGFPAGMGNDALAAGVDPRDPNQWQRGIDFALDNAAKNGWGAWYGAKAAGIGNRQGIGGARPAPQQVASLDPSIGMPQAQQASMPALVSPRATQQVTASQQPPQAREQPMQMAQAGNPMPPQQAGPSLQQLQQAAANPWLSEEQRSVVNSMLQQKMQENDPLRQLQLEKARLELEKLQRGDGADFKVVNDRLIKTYPNGTVEDVTPPIEGGGTAPLFDGKSVEAQGLNYLVSTNRLTREQAAQLAAGKQITDPSTGAIIFMTPEGIFGKQAGQPPQPLIQQQGGSRLLSPTSLGGAVQASQPAPAQVSPQALPEQGGQSGAIPLTQPKAQKIPDATRNEQAKINRAFDTIGGELDRYVALVKKNGIEAMPGETKDSLTSVRQGIMLQMKELFNLGVLNGPDLGLMEKMIYDPVVDPFKEGGLRNLPDQLYAAATGGAAERAQNSVTELKRMLTGIKDATDRAAAGTIGQTGNAPASGVPEGVDPKDWEFMSDEEKALFQ